MSEWDVMFEHTNDPAGRAVLAVNGEVDLAIADRLAAELAAALNSGAAVIDLSGVGFIDSSGVRELLRANQSAAEAGAALVLRTPSAACRRVLEISGVWSEFAIEDGAGLG